MKIVVVVAGVEKLKKYLSPDWILECVMFDRKRHALVISPTHCLEHGVTNIEIAQGRFSSKTILRFRLDYNLIKVKKNEPIEDKQT